MVKDKKRKERDKDMIIDTDRILPSIYEEMKPQSKYVLKLELNGTKIRISRDIVCPSNIRLSYLSEFLVRTMGFVGYHEHKFTDKDGAEYLSTSAKEACDEDFAPGEIEYRDFSEWTLVDLLKSRGEHMVWIYDFGDHFSHTLTLIDIQRYRSLQETHAEPEYFITGGENCCPPDDVGGADGYNHLIEVLQNPDDEEYREYKDWLYEGFDPARFNIHEARMRCWDFERTVETIRMRMDGTIPPEMRPAPKVRPLSWPRLTAARRSAAGKDEEK